ncbi:PIN domain-containing protein [Streptomyces mirabilis]|uniref:PIN domain-containing protein n=1 Tax=Streptomyces mirabilis TaxID=68239 RepID=UPI0038225B8C
MSTFLSTFEGFWRRPTKDHKNALRTYRIAIDTNVLLELYRFTPDARNEFIDVLSQLRDRIWVPHHVAYEYYNRRSEAIKEHLALYETVPTRLEEQKKKALQEIQTFAKRCSLSADAKKELTDPIEKAFASVSARISKHRSAFDLTLERVVNSDPVLKALGEIFDGRTGSPFNKEREQELIQEFQRRAAEEIPPGYRDIGKRDNAHGDFFVWEQMIAECAPESESLLFVTNDAKEDWVRREAGLIVGARPELIAEFRERCGADFLITQLGRFLQLAKEELGASVSASTVAQAENVTTDRNLLDDEFVILSPQDFTELQEALEAASDVSSLADPENDKEVRELGIISNLAARIADHISASSNVVKGEVRIRISTDDWKSAHSLWAAYREKKPPPVRKYIGVQRSAAARSTLANAERQMTRLKMEKEALLTSRSKSLEQAQKILALENEIAELQDRWNKARAILHPFTLEDEDTTSAF